MVENSELLRVPVFNGLPDDQISWFLSRAEDLRFKSGEAYAHQGDPADAMFVVLEGQVQARGEIAGETVMFSMKAGDVTGLLPFSRMKQWTIDARAVTDVPSAISLVAFSRAGPENAGADAASGRPDV